MRRREFLQALAASASLSVWTPSLARATSTPRRPPRYYVQILLWGGIDTILTLDPRVRAEVDPGIDLPYGANDIIDTGSFPLGPFASSLKKWAHRMAIVKGVQVGTANHPAGIRQFVRMKTNVTDGMPSILSIIARHRSTQPLGVVQLTYRGLKNNAYSSQAWFPGRSVKLPEAAQSRSILDVLQGLPPDDAEMFAEVLAEQAKSASDPETATSLTELGTALHQLRRAPPFKSETWTDVEALKPDADDLQRILWLLENDLTACVFSSTAVLLDTHYQNYELQKRGKEYLSLFARFLDELSVRRNRHGNLLENTLIFAGSELGRSPFLNTNLGKDHFPEIPALFLGSGVNTGTHGSIFGHTDRKMAAVPVSRRTGRPDGGDVGHIRLDDLGATVLDIAGIAPASNGYAGTVLPFLKAQPA